jgi:hypothetical protein
MATFWTIAIAPSTDGPLVFPQRVGRWRPVESGPWRGIPSQPMATPWGRPHQKIRPARAPQSGHGPSQWGRRTGAPWGGSMPISAHSHGVARGCEWDAPCGAKKALDMGQIWSGRGGPACRKKIEQLRFEYPKLGTRRMQPGPIPRQRLPRGRAFPRGSLF